MIPPKPSSFHPEGTPDGVLAAFVSFWRNRPLIDPRSLLVHTNGASVESSIESQKRWAEARPNRNTLPHYQVDRHGRGEKFLPTNRRGIANATVDAYQGSHGDISWFSLAIETTDTGYRDDPGISAFTAPQAETIARCVAYECVLHDIPVKLISEWYGAGLGSHTDPFGYPYTTLHRGKICPGDKKKRQMRELIIPRVAEIVDAWTGVTPKPKPDPAPELEDLIMPPEYVRFEGAKATFLRLNGEKLFMRGKNDRDYWDARIKLAGHRVVVTELDRGMAEATGPVINMPKWLRLTHNKYGRKRIGK